MIDFLTYWLWRKWRVKKKKSAKVLINNVRLSGSDRRLKKRRQE